MSNRPTERRIVDVLVAHLRASHLVAREIPHYEKRIDVGALSSGSAELWAIEAKTEDWSRALAQAVVNLAAAERSYIAIYAAHAHRVPREALEAHGIGLIAVGTSWGQVEFVVEAPRSQYTNRLAANRIRERMERGAR